VEEAEVPNNWWMDKENYTYIYVCMCVCVCMFIYLHTYITQSIT
jgi:hypothetical protein